MLFVAFDIDARSGISALSSLNDNGRVELLLPVRFSNLLVVRLFCGVDESKKPSDGRVKLLEACLVSRVVMGVFGVASDGVLRRERLDLADGGTLSNRCCFLIRK